MRESKPDTVYLDPHDVLHIPGLGFDGLVGYSPIAMAKNAIGIRAISQQLYNMIQQSSRAQGYFTTA